jgi:hypothetical protein
LINIARTGPVVYKNCEAILIETPGLDELRSGRGSAPQEHSQQDLENARALALMARDQLARDIADIEHASAALRRAEPALESWTGRLVASAPKPRPLWLLIGVLWVSTALITAGAVAAIAVFAG